MRKSRQKFKNKFAIKDTNIAYEISCCFEEPRFDPQNPHHFLKWAYKSSILEEKMKELAINL